LTPSRTFVTVPHDRAGRGIRLDAGRGTWRAVGLFLVLTIRLSGVFWVLINATQMSNPFYVWLLMWVPGCAALLTCRILRRPLRSMGWTWNWRYVLIGYLIAISFAQAWMRLKTGSIWPPIFLHASHNLWKQSVFTPLTTDTRLSQFPGTW
jgi:hypothetical protein